MKKKKKKYSKINEKEKVYYTILYSMNPNQSPMIQSCRVQKINDADCSPLEEEENKK